MTLLEPLLAFGEGLALIASPCILPVLPLVLAASVEGGRARPFGIITGFVVAFTAFVLGSRQIVLALGIEPDVIKWVSLVLLALFGLVLLSHRLSERFGRLTAGAADLGNRAAGAGGSGYGSGVVVGALIGLVWTPCAGPILAAVLVQVIRQESTLSSLLVVAPFALGAGVPMLAIALLGRQTMSHLGWFARHSETLRKAFGAVMLAAVAILALGIDPSHLLDRGEQPPRVALNGSLTLQDGLEQPYPAPELTGLQAWLNSNPLTLAQLRGKVVLIDFWTYSCINCQRTLLYLKDWDAKYRDKGLVIIGIHAPEFEFEKNAANVKAAVAREGIRYAVAQDNNLATWTAYQNRYWPAHYLIDRQGRVVYTHFGEGHYALTENNIRYLLGLDEAVADSAQKPPFAAGQTPETYLGHERAEAYAGHNRAVGSPQDYAFPAALEPDHWALAGRWTIEGERIVANAASASLRLDLTAKKVFLVMASTTGQPVTVETVVDGKPFGSITVTESRLYQVAELPDVRRALLELKVSSPGLAMYAFTFGG